MTRLLLALALLACAAPAFAARPITDLRAGTASEQTAGVTLTWTMPVLKANGDTLSTVPLDWEAGYSRQSPTWLAHAYWIKYNADTAAVYWPTVRAECEPLVVASGTATPGSIVAWPALDVPAGWWPYSWWIRTRQRPNGNWSRWSNPVSRADNQ